MTKGEVFDTNIRVQNRQTIPRTHCFRFAGAHHCPVSQREKKMTTSDDDEAKAQERGTTAPAGMQFRVSAINPLIIADDPVATMAYVGAVLENLADSLEHRETIPDPWGVALTIRCARCALQYHQEFSGEAPGRVMAIRGEGSRDG